jgi:putative endonuclease
MDKQYSLYIVRCSDNTYYTGMTSDLDKRIERHNSGEKDTWSKYTKGRQPVVLVFSFPGIKSIRAAYIGENYIKALTAKRKEKLISGDEKAVGLLRKQLTGGS